MSKIFALIAHFEDWDSSWVVEIGYFTSKKEAEDVKQKWDTFFVNGYDMFYEPDNWNPKDDPYYDHPFYTPDDDEYGLPGTQKFDWIESKAYEDLLTKYESIKHLKEFVIQEFELNKDLFIESPFFNGKKDLVKLMKSHNRDWSINKIIK